MSFSLNEADAMARKAARGAGYAWGLAEEAGYSLRWLCAHGVDGCAALVRVLDHFDGTRSRFRTIAMSEGEWRADDGPLCPFLAGTAVADRATILRDEPMVIADVVAPVLLIPFAADIARVRGMDVRLAWGASSAVTDGASLWGPVIQTDIANVTLSFGGDRTDRHDMTDRARPTPDVWARLDHFAARTYAPATEASRLMGAGAGTSDND